MSTSTPATVLLISYIVGQLQTITQPTYRTDIGAAVSSERAQTDDDAGPQVAVRLTGWEVDGEGLQIERTCSVQIDAQMDANADNGEAQAQLAIEDIWELFRRPAREVTLQADPYIGALIGVVESAVLERPEGARGIVARLTLTAALREVVPLPAEEV